jgi:hypothetical protein
MAFLTLEQRNAVRLSMRNGNLLQGVRVATGPWRLSLRRAGKALFRRKIPYSSPKRDLGTVPEFPSTFPPLYVAKASDLHGARGLDLLFSDVDRQLRGEFRLAGNRYASVTFGPSDQFDEIEDRYALERLYWAARYARAAAFGHANAYAGFRNSWTLWFNSPHTAVTFAAYTTAERIASLSECLFWLGHSVEQNAPEIISIKEQLWNDAHRLRTNLEYGLGVHNHILNDARGLFRASRVLADLPEAAGWQELAFELWDEYFPKLVREDGTFAEQSSHYHLLLCRTALEYFLATRLCHRSVPVGWELKLYRMFQLSNDLLRPDGSLPRFGDNSPDHPVEDLWGLMSAAYHYGLLHEPPRHRLTTPLTLLYCGEAPRLPGGASLSKSASYYPDGGFMFLKSPDRSAEVVVHMDPSSISRGHGDSGRGSFELWWMGQVIVREPGSILSSSNDLSAWSKSGKAQNVTCLNGLAPGVTLEDRRFLPASYANDGGAWTVQRETEGTLRWDGFRRLTRDVVLWRTWAFDEAGDLLLEEKIDGKGEVQFESRLFLGDGKWKLHGYGFEGEVQLRWSTPEGGSLACDLNLPHSVTPTLGKAWYFPEFGEKKLANLLVLTGNVTLPIRWTSRWQFSVAPSESTQQEAQECAE